MNGKERAEKTGQPFFKQQSVEKQQQQPTSVAKSQNFIFVQQVILQYHTS
jgi:hypothetical protein